MMKDEKSKYIKTCTMYYGVELNTMLKFCVVMRWQAATVFSYLGFVNDV